MPYTAIADADRDAESPLSDDLFQFIDEDLDWLKATLSNGVSAPQTITTNIVEAKLASGVGLAVTDDATIGGDLTVSGNATVLGTLNTGVFFSSEQILALFAF